MSSGPADTTLAGGPPADTTLAHASVGDMVASLEEQHMRLLSSHMSSIAHTVQGEAMRNLVERMDARNAALEARLASVEEQAAAAAAAAAKKESKWPQMAPALVALLGDKKGGGGPSEEEKAALAEVAGLGGDVAELRETVQSQTMLLREVHEDVHYMADSLYVDDAPERGRRLSVPPGYVGLEPPPADGGATSSGNGANAGGSGGSAGGKPRTRVTERRGQPRLDKLEQQVTSMQLGVEAALAEAGLTPGGGTRSGGTLAERLGALEQNVLTEVRTLASENAALKQQVGALSQAHAASEAALTQTRTELNAEMERTTARAAAAVDTAALERLASQVAAIEKDKATRHEFDALTDALREMRTEVIVGKGGGGGSDSELLATLQAAQQSTQGHVLSLQTHLRALLRKAEQEKASGVPEVDMTVVDGLRSQVHEALHELQLQVTALAENKADADKVEAALETKAERRLMAHKADRAFCEALLARFAVEVGRQLGDMEQNQLSIRGSLEEAVVRLMHSSVEHAAAPLPPPHSPKAGQGGSGHARAASGAAEEATAEKVVDSGSASGNKVGDSGGDEVGGSTPFSVRQLRVRSAGTTRSAPRGKVGSRGGRSSPTHDSDLPPVGMGQLAMHVFVTGDTEPPQADPQRYAFQPRRPAVGLITPGEQHLVRQRPMTAAGRLPTGQLKGSASSAGLLTTAAPSRSAAAGMRA